MLAQIILFDGFDLLDALAPDEVLHAGGLIAHNSLRVEFASFEGPREVPSGINGLRIPATAAIQPAQADFLFLPSGIDLGVYLLERHLGPRVAHAVESMFQLERRGTVWRAQGTEPLAW